MNYYAHYQQQEYDPSSQSQQLYDQPTNTYYSYSYSNPQYTAHPYPYYNHTVQPSHQEEQEPNPPGVTPPAPPGQAQNSYYQLTVGPQQGAVVPQPIVQPSYSGVGIINGIAPAGGDAQTLLGPKLNVPSQPYQVHGHGRGLAPSHIQGGLAQPLSQSYAGPHLIPGQSISARSFNGRGRGRGSGRGRGRGRGRAAHKYAVPPAHDNKICVGSGSDIQGGPPQPVPQSVAPSFGQMPVPFQGPAQPKPVLPPSKAVCCELCRVECNTVEILEQHMNGKKHKKKLKVFEELQNLNKRVIRKKIEQPEAPSQPVQIEGSENQQLKEEILPSQETNEESKVAVEEQKVEEVETAEESMKKVKMERSGGVGRGLKRKMRGGKGSRKMRPGDRSKKSVEPPKPKEFIPLVCELCNVKCESLVVFQSHLVGKKHQSKAKRFMGHQETLGQEPLQPQRLEMQASEQQNANANASTSIVSHVQDIGFVAYQGASTSIVSQVQNVNKIDGQASTFESVSLPESLGTNIEGTSKEGHSETGVQSDDIVQAQ